MAEFLTQDTTQVFERLVWEARRLEKHKHERSYRKVCFLASTEDREIAEIAKSVLVRNYSNKCLLDYKRTTCLSSKSKMT